MKKLLFVGFFAFLAMGCDRSEPTGIPTPAHLELSENSVRINCLGDGTRLDLTHNYVWEYSIPSDVAEWLSLEVEDDDEATRIVLTATANESEEERSGSVTFSSQGLTETLTVTQEALLAEVSASELGVEFDGGTDRLTFSTTFPTWEVSVTSQEEWISAGKEGTDGIVITTGFNDTDAKRIATINITAGPLVREVTVIQDYFVFEVTPTTLDFSDAGGTLSINVDTNASEWTWDITAGTEWITAEKSGENSLSVTALQNSGAARSGAFTILTGDFSRSVSVVQYSANIIADKEVVQLQSASVGSGVNLVLLGDGYIASDMVGDGKYQKDMHAGMEHFFSVYPYSDFREYFNVWMVGAVSNESGASMRNPQITVDTVFKCVLDGGNSTGISCNAMTVMDYVRPVADLAGKSLSEITVIMPINKYIYAGTCSMYISGFSISMCPVGPTYRNIVIHEAGGHGFGKLTDEYVYYPYPYPEQEKASMQRWQEDGHFLNADFDGDIANTFWSEFAGNPDYPMVGTWEGADRYQYGIWRCEYNSCMNDNVPYFNAQSRYMQMDRIHKWAGEEYSFEQFLEEDIIPPYPANARVLGAGVLAPFVPLAPPILMTTPIE